MDYLAEALFTLFVIIDPIGVIPIFMAVTHFHTKIQRRRIAFKASIISLILLLFFAFVGDFVLDTLKIAEYSFRIAGGILLLLAAINMVVRGHLGTLSGEDTSEKAKDTMPTDDVSVFPLAIPMIAGPGALVSVIILMRGAADTLESHLGIAALIAIVIGVTYLCLLLSDYIIRFLGITGTNVLSRVFGIILAAFAVQFIIDGIGSSVTAYAQHLPTHIFLQPKTN